MTALELYDLICEYRTNPIGLGEVRPRLGWKLRASRRGARQTAYRIRAASQPDDLEHKTNLIWDSGRVTIDQSIHVEFDGPSPASRERIWWQVQVWDELGNSATSRPAWWEMGLLHRKDWEPARWIAGPLFGGKFTTVPLPFLRREFSLTSSPVQARLYVTALGLYECSLNGTRVGQDWFTPGWTDYNKRVQYQVYDVTSLLRTGDNVWGAVLGDGWYCGYVSHFGRQVYGDRPKVFAKLVVSLEDGTTQTIGTDANWQVKYGALLGSDNYNGETYDARLEQPGWDKPGFPAHGWQPVDVVEDPGIELSPNFGAPVRKTEELPPVAFSSLGDDPQQAVWICDFGQNMAGRVRLRIRGERGETVRLRFAEMLNPDGSLYTANFRSALQTDMYTLKGEGEEIWEPRFTYHGFRYVELSGGSQPPGPETLTALVMHSAMQSTGTFECSDPLVNRLQHNIVWGAKSNFFDVPTDCPFRDERLGWTGDTQLFMRTAAYNMEVAPFFYKWLRDVVDAQSVRGGYPTLAPRPGNFLWDDGGPAWGEAGIICPWTLYLFYGDKRILERNYESMQRFFQFLLSTSENYLRPPADGASAQGFGDWMALDAPIVSDGSKYAAWQGGTPKLLIGTAFFAYAASLLAKIAYVLNLADDAAEYEETWELIRSAFAKAFIGADGRIQGDTQTGYALALYFELVPERLRSQAVAHLLQLIQERDMHLTTGFVGTPYLAPVLSEQGHADTAYAILLQQTYPSWLYIVLQGATTVWERWDSWTPERGFQDPAMNSFNHIALGSIGEWFYRTIAGLESDVAHPGFKHIVLHPRPGGSLSWARGAYESLYGTIVSEWALEGNKFVWRVTVPPNTTATVYVPSKGDTVLEGGVDVGKREGIEQLGKRSDTLICSLAPGEYQFESLLG